MRFFFDFIELLYLNNNIVNQSKDRYSGVKLPTSWGLGPHKYWRKLKKIWIKNDIISNYWFEYHLTNMSEYLNITLQHPQRYTYDNIRKLIKIQDIKDKIQLILFFHQGKFPIIKIFNISIFKFDRIMSNKSKKFIKIVREENIDLVHVYLLKEYTGITCEINR